MIETQRLLLMPLHDDDAVAIAENINSYAISKNLARVPYPYTLADAHEFLAWAKALDARSRFFTLRLKTQPDVLIGMISYDWTEDKQRAELGYWLVQPFWGQGLMSEAARAVVRHSFEVTGHPTLASCFFNDNPASGKVLMNAGFEVVGPCLQFSKAQNREVPVTEMVLTKARWEKHV